MMFLDCPAWLDETGALRCGLPAEVRCRFTMISTDGPLESAMITCPAGHFFSGPVEFLSLESQTAAGRPALNRQEQARQQTTGRLTS
jgi:hypothetical protein